MSKMLSPGMGKSVLSDRLPKDRFIISADGLTRKIIACEKCLGSFLTFQPRFQVL